MDQTRTILTEINTLADFKELLENNPGTIVIKFGAEWCGPCKKIEPLVKQWFDHLIKTTSHIQPVMIDVDECLDVYAFLKNKKMLNGIPAILAYKKGNTHYVPDSVVIGANVAEVNQFFTNLMQ